MPLSTWLDCPAIEACVAPVTVPCRLGADERFWDRSTRETWPMLLGSRFKMSTMDDRASDGAARNRITEAHDAGQPLAAQAFEHASEELAFSVGWHGVQEHERPQFHALRRVQWKHRCQDPVVARMAEKRDSHQVPGAVEPKPESGARIRRRIVVRQDEFLGFSIAGYFRYLIQPRIDRFAGRAITIAAQAPPLVEKRELRRHWQIL